MMMSDHRRVLIVDDEPALREMVAMTLTQAGFSVVEAGDASQARRRLAECLPDLMLLDWMLPGMSGIDFARMLRASPQTRRLPIIMLTARGEEEERIHGLEVGADDYITKPFSTRELVARARAVLRRSSDDVDQRIVSVGGLVLDPQAHRVSDGQGEIPLGPTEFRLLRFFMSHPDRVYSRGQLLDYVWGSQTFIEERTVDVHIRRLRKALAEKKYDRFIQTVRGSGYRFSSKVT